MRINPLPLGSAAALGQSTPAMQQQIAKGYGRRGGRKSASKRRGKAKSARPRSNGRKRSSGRSKPAKGSAAMKRKMARLRAMRGKKR